MARKPAAKSPAPADAKAPTVDLAALKTRSQRAWSTRGVWQALYNEAYEYAIPYRRPANGPNGIGQGAPRVERVFDNTAIISTFRFAGQLQNDLFPPGQPWFKLQPGPVAEQTLSTTTSRSSRASSRKSPPSCRPCS
jgi:hypothetical protein